MDIQTETKRVMELKSLTQAEIAKEAGIHPVTLCNLLKDPKRPDSAYDKLVRYLSTVLNEGQLEEGYHDK